MSSFIQPNLIIGLDVSEIKNKSIEELNELCSMVYACDTGTKNICFDFFNQEFEDEYTDASFGLAILDRELESNSIDLGVSLDNNLIQKLSKHFKELVGQEPKFLATFFRY